MRELMTGWGVACLLFLLVHQIPSRSEWMVGGWDPGIYTNEALQLVRTGSLQGEAHPFACALGSETVTAVIREMGTHTEIFPGVPIDTPTGTVLPSFPRMPVAFLGGVGQWMGPEGVFKGPLIFAILVLITFVALVLMADLGPHQALAVLILMAGQPLFIHYAVTPSSEMIELLLLSALFLALWLGRFTRHGWVWVGLLVMTLAANRTSFLLFGSLGLVGLALWDGRRMDRRQVLIEHGALGVALWLGHFILGLITPVAIYKLAHVLPRIYMASLILIGLTLVLDGLATGSVLRNLWGLAVQRFGPWILPAFWLILLAVVMGGRFFGLEISRNFQVWVSFSGVFCVAATAGGSWGASLRRSPEMGTFLLFLGLALGMVLWQKHVAELYPWALKRFLVWGVPLVSLGASFFCADWARRGGRQWMTWVLALILVAPSGRLVLQAWRSGEYIGVNRTLQEVARRMDENAWVICDHFQWATPLWFAFGHASLDGHRLIDNPDAPQTIRFWRRVADLQRQGRTVYLLSSNDSDADPWVAAPGTKRLEWRSGPLLLQEIHQHSSNRDFPVRKIPHEFKVYEWQP